MWLPLQVAETALQAVGLLTIARPAIMVDRKSQAKAIMKRALQQSAHESFKLKALSNLTELLRADEQSLLSRQQEAADAGGGEGGGGGGAKKRGGKSGKRGSASDLDSADRGSAVQTQNGEGDTLSQSSSILQDNWEAVLALATDTSPSPSSPAGRGVYAGTLVRRRVVELMETVLRRGVAARLSDGQLSGGMTAAAWPPIC